MRKSNCRFDLKKLNNNIADIFIDGRVYISLVNGELNLYSPDSSIGDIFIEPTHRHDCESCVLLDSYYEDGKHYDLYFCKQGGIGDTVIARYGENEEYYSGLTFSSTNKHLKKAKELSEKLGFLKLTSDNSDYAVQPKASPKLPKGNFW